MYGNKIDGNQQNYLSCINWFILPLADKCAQKRGGGGEGKSVDIYKEIG